MHQRSLLRCAAGGRNGGVAPNCHASCHRPPAGWCPPLPAFRWLGVRTNEEIQDEAAALRALRGDYAEMCQHAGVKQVGGHPPMLAPHHSWQRCSSSDHTMTGARRPFNLPDGCCRISPSAGPARPHAEEQAVPRQVHRYRRRQGGQGGRGVSGASAASALNEFQGTPHPFNPALMGAEMQRVFGPLRPACAPCC